MSAAPMTPAHIAVAIVAACGATGTKPDKVFEEGNGRPRVMAAAGCIAHLGWDKTATARAFRVHPNRLTPSGLSLARVFIDHLQMIAEALDVQGLGPVKLEIRPVSPAPAAEARPQRKTGKAAQAAAKAPDPTPATPSAPKPTATVRTLRANPVRPTPTPARSGDALKPITDRVVRWTQQQLARGADLAFVAWCFDVDVIDLGDAVRPTQAAAA